MIRTFVASAVVVAIWVGQPSAVQLPPFGGAEAFRADLAQRRARVMEKLGPETVAILWSAPVRVYSNDVNYEYRQDSNLLYLTGDDQEETILVLVPGAKTKREILFTREADPRRELWNGHVLTLAEASAATGITEVYPRSAFQKFIDGVSRPPLSSGT